jgi:hypothetical protein
MLIAISVVVLQIAACLGLGAAALRLAGVAADLAAAERLAWSFTLGMGLLGWIIFFPGIAGVIPAYLLAAILIVAALGLVLLRLELSPMPVNGPALWVAGAALVVSGLFDLIEALSPVADADTSAYHFDLPRRFLEAGRVFFVPRALDGATPLLLQMTYLSPLALGGELALNLWMMATGFGATFLLYTIARRYLSSAWSLALALVFATTPAVVYVAGTGMVEAKLAAIALVGAIAAGEALRSGKLGFAAVAGLAAGFYMGGKYFGLLYAAAVGLVLLWGSGWLARAAVFSLAALAAGSQWYAWNWLHSGDPVFPMLYGVLPYADDLIWDAAHARAVGELDVGADRLFRPDLYWFVAYPFRATLSSLDEFESRRTGLGPLVLLLLPFALGGWWQYRARLRKGPLAAVALIALLFYCLWFWTGVAQRVRHLLPVYPLLLLVVTVAAVRFAERCELWRPLVGAFAITAALQLSAHGLFTAKFVRYVFAGQDREQFLEQNVSRYAVAQWINAHLAPTDRVLSPFRDLAYHIRPRVYQAHVANQALVDVLPSAEDPARFMAQLRAQGITYVIVDKVADPAHFGPSGYAGLIYRAWRGGCFAEAAEVTVIARVSRTLAVLGSTESKARILRRADASCAW